MADTRSTNVKLTEEGRDPLLISRATTVALTVGLVASEQVLVSMFRKVRGLSPHRTRPVPRQRPRPALNTLVPSLLLQEKLRKSRRRLSA